MVFEGLSGVSNFGYNGIIFIYRLTPINKNRLDRIVRLRDEERRRPRDACKLLLGELKCYK